MDIDWEDRLPGQFPPEPATQGGDILGNSVRVPRHAPTRAALAAMAAVLLVGIQLFGVGHAAHAAPRRVAPRRVGELDCNGQSPIQRSVRATMICADPRGIERGERFEDNGTYIGHDEPSVRFISSRAGSGNDVTFGEQLPLDPSADPTVNGPLNDVTHFFELSVAPWFGMALCDPQSYPQAPCTPNSDRNAPTERSLGGGVGFTEMQFYPPGFAPIIDAGSCDNTHWCAALLTFSLEFDAQGNFNPNCIEPVNFAFIQTDGTPTGPPSPQLANVSSFTPNANTLLMNPGDDITVHMFDADLGGGQHALREQIVDHTTGQTGFMTASAANGFMHTSIVDCSGTPFNWEPDYSTAKPRNQVSWAALEGAIFTQFEIGHFEPCTDLADPSSFNIGFPDTFYQTCIGPYEETASPDPGNPEVTDAPCYFKGDTHGGIADPDTVTGCEPVVGPFAASSDLDYDGTSYWADWPTSLTPNQFPSPFLQAQPLSHGHRYPRFNFETTAPATEATCMPDGSGCAVPPPGAPGNFYPYWTLARVNGQCVWEFGQMQNGNTFGGAAQYGGPSARFFGTLESPIMENANRCGSSEG
jgi:hypothetical protein